MGDQLPDICCFELFIWLIVIKINYPFNAAFSQSFSFLFFFGTKDIVVSKQNNTGYLEKAEQTIPGSVCSDMVIGSTCS